MGEAATRRRVPRRRQGRTTQVTISGEDITLIATADDDGLLADVAIHWGKHGTATSGLMDMYALAVTIAVRHHVPLTELVAEHRSMYFAPSGATDDPDLPVVRSPIDWVVRRLALDWLPYAERTQLGVLTLQERLGVAQEHLDAESFALTSGTAPADPLDGDRWMLATTIGAPPGQ
ncbi:hypothetical protein JOL79_28735 [Microbispora sp. RL4-1S]|uniref:ribonucleoside-diphosphate reductase n=1 Tax=Microbispora oryzae TaxID=2806554 RepID=A0A941AMY6_9ACTN|nr:hypothetical protein [Microbispora oryzae]MBP2707773.1 hypothetical protein [Microbispora oryzae]